jgi:hypothetical protein
MFAEFAVIVGIGLLAGLLVIFTAPLWMKLYLALRRTVIRQGKSLDQQMEEQSREE